jgi:hypothetical protein
MNKEAIGTLTGKYFHSVKSDRETIEWQGTFLGLASPGLYRVQLFEWINGSESEQRLVPATDMRYWKIYDAQEQMMESYRRYQECRVQRQPNVNVRGLQS